MSHKERAIRLFRHCLRNARDWAVHAEVWESQIARIRGEFEKNRLVTDKRHIERLLRDSEARLRAHSHPDPYIPPYFPGGSKYQRNPPADNGPTLYMNFGRE